MIDENGKNNGKILLSEALNKAKLIGLDLVEVGSGKVPTCKIMDYGKWKYQQTKSNRKRKQSQNKQVLKEVKIRPTTGDNDLKFKARHVDDFIEKGFKTKIVIKFKGREQEHMLETGKQVLEKFIDFMTADCVMDIEPKLEGNSIVMIIAPRR